MHSPQRLSCRILWLDFSAMCCFIPLKRIAEKLKSLTLMMTVCLGTKAVAMSVMTTTQALSVTVFALCVPFVGQNGSTQQHQCHVDTFAVGTV
jgi:hypothetical protein